MNFYQRRIRRILVMAAILLFCALIGTAGELSTESPPEAHAVRANS